MNKRDFNKSTGKICEDCLKKISIKHINYLKYDKNYLLKSLLALNLCDNCLQIIIYIVSRIQDETK